MSIRIDRTQPSAAFIETIVKSPAQKNAKKEKIRQIMLVLVEEMFIILPEGNHKNISFALLEESLKHANSAMENLPTKAAESTSGKAHDI